jgi:hypothetical protein
MARIKDLTLRKYRDQYAIILLNRYKADELAMAIQARAQQGYGLADLGEFVLGRLYTLHSPADLDMPTLLREIREYKGG